MWSGLPAFAQGGMNEQIKMIGSNNYLEEDFSEINKKNLSQNLFIIVNL